MQLYFVPFASSLAARIAIEEAGLEAEYVHYVPGESARPGGTTPMEYVPALHLSDGRAFNEATTVLQFIADLAPGSGLAPAPESGGRYALQAWLNFIATELHKGVFDPLISKTAPEGAREWARSLLPGRFEPLSRHLDGREFLLDRFTVADAYLVTILNWCEYSKVDLSEWPVLKAYRDRLRARPSVARAIAAELPLLKAA